MLSKRYGLAFLLLAGAAAMWLGAESPAEANVIDTIRLNAIKRKIAGQVLDYTSNHWRNNRIHSQSLCADRDLYVYLPPCYDASFKYPVIFYFHGFAQDERSFYDLVPALDQAIQCGRMPPTIVIAIDGTIRGKGAPWMLKNSSFYINSKAGQFEDYVMNDVWNWAHANFSIRPEREAHVFAGVSMGGGSAFDLGMRHRNKVGVVAAIFPAINLRYLDCHDDYMADFDPNCWKFRTEMKTRFEVVGQYFGGLVKIRMGSFISPLFDWGEAAVLGMSQHNPTEHLTRENIQNGELAMYLAYGGRDEFNIDAQIDSFLHVAKSRGIDVTVNYDPNGRHDARTAMRFVPCILGWVGDRLAGYGPTR